MSNKRFVAALLALATTTSVGSPAVAAAPTPGQYYQMQVVNSGLRLEVAFASTGSAPIIQGAAAPSYRPSNWRFDAVAGGFYRIVNRNSGNCLYGGSASVRQVIYQNRCVSNNALENNTHWRLTSVADNFRITNRTSGLSLCIIGDLTFTSVPLVSDNTTSSCDKRFKLIPVT